MAPRHAGRKKTSTPAAPAVAEDIRITWHDILSAWIAIELDLQDQGIDVESGILRERSWRWLSTRIAGLIANKSSRLRAALLIPPDFDLDIPR
ncbi:hypothetical protein [Rhodococcus globerulus]|jgi:hypothetical protein|uniref:hypothetical protein n=1 Tax=Rhodococcus globerulus TaxID=33008 RepID=UPI00301ADFE9